jgi:hypothetical protein
MLLLLQCCRRFEAAVDAMIKHGASPARMGLNFKRAFEKPVHLAQVGDYEVYVPKERQMWLLKLKSRVSRPLNFLSKFHRLMNHGGKCKKVDEASCLTTPCSCPRMRSLASDATKTPTLSARHVSQQHLAVKLKSAYAAWLFSPAGAAQVLRQQGTVCGRLPDAGGCCACLQHPGLRQACHAQPNHLGAGRG